MINIKKDKTMEKFTRKEIVKNLFFIRRSNNFEEYKKIGGTGSKLDYCDFLKMEKLKAENLERHILSCLKG